MQTFSYRWLGTAGLEFKIDGDSILIDPFFTRPPMRKLLRARVLPDRETISKRIQSARAILVTHAHYDHLLDVPAIVQITGAEVYGSANVITLLMAAGIQRSLLHEVKAGDSFQIADVPVTVFRGRHHETPASHILNSPLPADLRYPFRLRDYRMDACFAYRFELGGRSILVGETPAKADLAFITPMNDWRTTQALLEEISPSLVVPIHWDNFFRPVQRRARLSLRRESEKRNRPDRFDLRRFKRKIETSFPGMKVHIPDVFEIVLPTFPDQKE
jgi:L-ascorbate metabolism protein UlaG (beta-lactamase superfamily)